MDIYFCDECGARVTDLDLRAGKGMRKRQDTICAGCVDHGLAGAWLARVGLSAPAAAMRSSAGSAALEVDAPSDRIAVARDRARTAPDEPFTMDEPAPLKPLVKPVAETDAIPAQGAKRQAPLPVDEPRDGLAAAGGGFGALVGAGMPPPPPGFFDDPEELEENGGKGDAPASTPAAFAEEAAGPVAQAESPFDFVHPVDSDNPGKAETSEVQAVDKGDDPKAAAAGKAAAACKATRVASGRQQVQKRGSSTTSKRNQVKAVSVRRPEVGRMKSNKVILFSLASCAVMLIVFFGFVLPSVGKPKGGQAQQITLQPLDDLKRCVEEAKQACHKALSADDLPTIKHAGLTLDSMMQALAIFEKAASKQGWKEEDYGEQLRLIGFYDVQGMRKGVKDRLFIVEQRQ